MITCSNWKDLICELNLIFRNSGYQDDHLHLPVGRWWGPDSDVSGSLRLRPVLCRPLLPFPPPSYWQDDRRRPRPGIQVYDLEYVEIAGSGRQPLYSVQCTWKTFTNAGSMAGKAQLDWFVMANKDKDIRLDCTFKEWSKRLVTFEKFDKCDENLLQRQVYLENSLKEQS